MTEPAPLSPSAVWAAVRKIAERAAPTSRPEGTFPHVDVAGPSRLDQLLAEACKPSVLAWDKPEPIDWDKVRESVNRPYAPPTYYVHPAAWDAHVAGECTCGWFFPAPCAVHDLEPASSD